MQPDDSKIRPYAPSFVDLAMDFVRRLPIHYWLTYLLLFSVQGSAIHVLAWAVGWQPVFTFIPISLVFPLWLWGPLAIMTYLGSVSLDALSSFSPLLDIPQERTERLKYEFTVMPARGAVLNGVIWTILYLFMTYLTFEAFYVGWGLGTLLSVVNIAAGLVTFATGSALYYHSLRQLRLVNLTVRMAGQFNLFRLDPAYAFSRVTSRIGIAWMILLSATLVLFPLRLASAPVVAMLIVQVGLTVAAFVLPLWFVNRRLVDEKRRLLADLNRRVESTLDRLHRRIDAQEWGEIKQLNEAMAGLRAERDVLTGIPTWPWRSETLTGLLSAIVLPIILILLQLAIGKWFGG